MEPDEYSVDCLRHEWAEHDRAVVLRYMTHGSSSRWGIQEMDAHRDRDGLLRWRDKRLLHQGSGISYGEGCELCLEFAEKAGGKVPVFATEEHIPKENWQHHFLKIRDKGSMLVAQWRQGDFVNNRKNRILRTLKEDL